MRMGCRRYYPFLVSLLIFIAFQLFLKLNRQSNTNLLEHQIADKLIQDINEKALDHKELPDDLHENLPDDNDKDNAAPIELDAKNSHNEKQIEAVDFDKDIELKAQPDDYEKDNAAPIELDAKNSHNEKQIDAVDPDKDIEPKAQSDKSEKPNEDEAKKMIAQDVLNDENENAVPIKTSEDKDQELFIFPDQTKDADLYKLDYSVSHPFENECRYPILEREEPDLLKYIRHYRRVQCPPVNNNSVPMVSQLVTGEIMIGVPHRAKFRSGIKCMGKELSGTLRKDKRKLLEIGEWFEIPQDRRVFINKDQFIIKCTDNAGKVVLTDVFASLSEKPRLKPESVDQPDKYNIDIFILDSTARNQFFRHMPLMLQFMRRLDFKFLHGHTKVGDNSAINLLPLLAGKAYDLKKRGLEGMVREEIALTENMLKEDFWKYSNMLIQIARDQGCPTLWNDDIASVGFGLFSYYAFPGFITPPADYYYRPFYTYLYSQLNAGSSCANGEFLVPRYVQIWERFARRFAKECHFSFNFMTGLTHASSNSVELYDQDLSESLNRMERDGVLDHSFVFIMGDHGQRISAIQKSYTGRIEERMPLVAIHIPKKFRHQHPDKVKQLEINQNRLTSNFDLHETIREIMGLEKNREPVGRSLFHEISTNRDCYDAKVPANFCMCQTKLNGSILNDKEKIDIFDIFASEIGGIMAEYGGCVKSHKLLQNINYTPYTISNQARNGIRYPSELEKFIRVHGEPKAEDNEIFDVEFDASVDIQTKTNKMVNLKAKSRVLWNRDTKQGRLTATPLIIDGPCGGIRRLDEICQCNEKS